MSRHFYPMTGWASLVLAGALFGTAAFVIADGAPDPDPGNTQIDMDQAISLQQCLRQAIPVEEQPVQADQQPAVE